MSFKIFNIGFLLNIGLLFVFLNSATAIVFPNETTLVFYYGPDFEDSTVYELSDSANILKDSNFKNEQSHLFIHGWGDSQDSETIHNIVDAYLKRNNINLITVDWAKAAGDDYATASLENIELLAPALSDAIINLYNTGMDRQSLTVICHSLGCQLAGMTGRTIIEKSEGALKIYKLTLLDAAYPLFSPSPPFVPTVDKNDAEFVQAIHTDGGVYGEPIPLGHVDFWPNGGRRIQPGCPLIATPLSSEEYCSHQRSWRYWAEIVSNINDNNPKFLGYPSSNFEEFLSEGVASPFHNWETSVEMGINCPMNARGNYYLTTNNQSLFARGTEGFYYD